METTNVESLIANLEDNLDDLKDALAPLLSGPLSDTASKLPILDKAQLYILWVYALESVLFCMHALSAKISV